MKNLRTDRNLVNNYSGKAIVWNRKVFHPSTDLTIRRVKVPRIDKKEVLVKLKAAGICASDIHYMEDFLMYSKIPIIPGHEGSGVIEEVGEGVTNVGPGDRVVVHYVTACGE